LPYDDARQIAVVQQGNALIPAVELHPPPQTKKGDIEKGEDQKDRW
jgi:predicted RNA-binding protein with PIN domain